MVDFRAWLAKMAKLSVYRAKGGPAPHKPLLLLIVLELAEQGLLPDGVLQLTAELAFRFCGYWAIVAHRRTQRPDVRMPFHHLHNDGFWSAFQEDGRSSPDDRLTRYVVPSSDFFVALQDSHFRESARRILIAKYFRPDEQIALSALVGLPIPSEEALGQAMNSESVEQYQKQGRQARFRLNVVAAYHYTCALTGYQLTTISAGSVVDAAHIHQFANSRNNDPRNGIGLSKNAHWLFDNGLWTLSDDYTVMVAMEQFAEQSPDQKALRDYNGKKIRLPDNPAYWPDIAHIAWHRTHKFLKS